MRKVYYIYNPRTQTYDRIYPTVRQRALSILRRLFIGMGLGAGSFIVLLIICIVLFYKLIRCLRLSVKRDMVALIVMKS